MDNIGNMTIESGGNQQAVLAIKASKAKQHGPIRIRTHLHPRMNSAIRPDGADAELTEGIDIEWLWEPIVATTRAGPDAYQASYMHMDTVLTDTVRFHFVPHVANATNDATLDVGGLGARPMVFASDDPPLCPGQLRPGAMHRATYQPTTDIFGVYAVNWERNVPLLDVNDNTVRLPGNLVDGEFTD